MGVWGLPSQLGGLGECRKLPHEGLGCGKWLYLSSANTVEMAYHSNFLY